MKPLFSAAPPTSDLPLFAYGQLLQGQPLAWAMGRSIPVEAQLRGRLWRLPSGTVMLSLDPRAGWILGELHAGPGPQVLTVLPDLLGTHGLEPALRQARARVGMRAQLVQAWVASDDALRRVGAHPLKSGSWRRVAPR
jgi:gamma-glutamylcyclotransferase (GGCT)/AIG2-like uncharacterized protein YtfP